MQSQPCRVFSGPCHTCTEQSAHTGYNLYAPFQTSLFHKLSDFKFALLRHSAYSAPCRETRCRKQKYCFLFFRQYVVYEIRRNVPENRMSFSVFLLEIVRPFHVSNQRQLLVKSIWNETILSLRSRKLNCNT